MPEGEVKTAARMLEKEDGIGMSKQDLRSPSVMAHTLGYDVYADILASTISTLSTPSNVGVFAGWGSGKSYLLKKIKDILHERSKHYPTTQGRFLMWIWMLLRLIFFLPPLAVKRSNEVRFIPAYFNALEYAGSDNLWAGLVTKLVESVEIGIGRVPSAIFRAKPTSNKTFELVVSSNPKKLKFRPIKLCQCLPLWIFAIVATCICLAGGILLLVYALNKQAYLINQDELRSENTTSSEGLSLSDNKQKSSLGLGAILLSIPAIAFFKNFIPVLVKFINTQQAQIKRIVSKPDFSKELGVMAKVKKEIYHLNKLIHFMERFEGRRIVIAIFIDDLDKLPQQNIAPLLQAIKILLTDRDSRFVSIIAIDPYFVSDALEMGIQSEFPAINMSGHKFLKQMIQVPFSIPEMDEKEKGHLFGVLVKRNRLSSSEIGSPSTEVDEDVVDGGLPAKVKGVTATDGLDNEDDELKTLLVSRPTTPCTEMIPMKEKRKPDLRNVPLDKHLDVIAACDCVMEELQGCDVFPFIKNNLQEMLRLVGIVKVTTRVIFHHLEQLKRGFFCPKGLTGILPSSLAAWVVLVGQWPYRTAWMIQQVEDKREQSDAYPGETPLMKIYSDVEHNFTLVRDWKKLIQLDEDPDVLENFLEKHSHWLNADFLIKLIADTISINRSLKSIVSCAAVERDMKSSGSMPNKRLAIMDKDDVVSLIKSVCEGSKHVEKYVETVIENEINGPALLRGNVEDIKQCLGMSLGDWIQFSHVLAKMKVFHKFNS